MRQLQTLFSSYRDGEGLLTCSAGAHTTSSANDLTATTVRFHFASRSAIDVTLALRLLSELHRQQELSYRKHIARQLHKH